MCSIPLEQNLRLVWRACVNFARLLISKGADVQNISARGWTPAFRLWYPWSSSISLENLQLLSAASFDNFDAQDAFGWSSAHRAAFYGKAEDVLALQRLNTSFTLLTSNLMWPPVFCAVRFGNVSTFHELRKSCQELLTMTDARRWTLLHIAVNAWRLALIEDLINLGVDPHTRSLATEFLVPEELKKSVRNTWRYCQISRSRSALDLSCGT